MKSKKTKPKADRMTVKRVFRCIKRQPKIRFKKNMNEVEWLDYLRALRDAME
jgi:hypothetical protein